MLCLSSRQEIHITDAALALQNPGLFAMLWRRLHDWLSEPAYADEPTPRFSSREWADLPVHHPIRDDRGDR